MHVLCRSVVGPLAGAIFSFVPLALRAQQSEYAVRFYGTGTGQADRVKIRIDAPGNPLNVGDDFTIEFWIRCSPADNNGVVYNTFDGDGWITGNTIVDRDIFAATDYGDYGIAIGVAGTSRVVAFGVANSSGGRTIVGTNNVCDGRWHHIAVTRVRTNGILRIYIDGRLDAQGTGPVGTLAYRSGRSTSWPDSDPYLVFGAEKHDAGSAYPSFNGFFDEFRMWTQALTQVQISNVFREIIATNTPGLVAYYRFEEGSGTNVFDSTAKSPPGMLIAGITNNGQWMARAINTNWTAPVGQQTPPPPPPPSTNVTIESLPSGLLIHLDNGPEATPFTRTLPITNLVWLSAPSNQALNGTTFVFRCWSDGGPQQRWLLVPSNGITLRAGYAAVPGGSIDQPVPALNRQIESYAGTNTFVNVYVANCLCVGRDNSPQLRYEPAMAFPLHVPQGASIQSATLRLRGNSDNSGTPNVMIRAYAASNIAPFVAGPGPSVTGLYPLTSASVSWSPPPFANNTVIDTPDLSALVQEVISRSDWTAGNFIGFVLTAVNAVGDHWRCWSNFQSGTPPRLLVSYSTGAPAGTDIDGDGMPDEWEAQFAFDCTTHAPAGLDSDADGTPDVEEFIALTDPRSPTHFPFISIVATTGASAWAVSTFAVTGRLYRIDAATNLHAGTWQTVVSNWPGAGGPWTWFDTNDAPARAFRLGIQLAP